MSARIFPQGAKSMAKAAIGIALALVLSACAAQYRNHGYVPTPDQLRTVNIGDTQEEVASAIGRPTTEGILDRSGWYYVRSRFRHLGAFEPKEVDRQVLAISFDGAGRVSNIERFGLEQGRVVVLDRRVTESNVQGITFLRQLFSNVGNITAEQLLQ
ncbi:outer membrane protein assembly factor BamE [Celeribacter indicus]|uniref:SmpA/OmlA domain-containing protein n=1 Tax=Celeribacter indicus TaxID=1208324 RepID=A0A0B5E1V6_9RHOB|nr:outer membrane protein assembly factor BamE [Celeribacter indicus]AJE47390.1 SmpA/OmlA domain-containing protein [Celeribacter indicus]SDW05327.1 Beta-barrel assembly machine subunit BamE [Celeribacter indicus]